ncbi:MAG: carboxylesterase family protein [Clostridiales bacterium]|nr:carboxylesterase family protein [Clostridiales bacterium]
MAIREVTAENGKLLGAPSGIPSTTVFRGIPYAAPPVGELRWKPPAPAADWEGVRVAHSFAKVAMQLPGPEMLAKENMEYPEPMDEDCLYLNIWTPAKSADERLPVLLWIHGGAFFAGHSYGTHVDGDYLAEKGIILVSIAYRLGVFGFMCHPELSAENGGSSGNYGILDQICALKWVRRNISAFGGDPDKITIAGQSAGASSVQTIISSPLSEGDLFGAVMMSGPAARNLDFIAPGTLAEAEDFGIRLLKELNISSVAQARAVGGQEFMDMAAAAARNITGPFGMPFKPVVDGRVLKKSQAECAFSGDIPDINYMVGHTDEGLLDPPVSTMAGYERWIAAKFKDRAEEAKAAFSIKNEADLAALRPDTIKTALIAAAHSFCRRNDTLGKKPAYYYHFQHKLPGDELGAFHGGELWYFFNKLNRCWRPFTSFDHELARICAGYLANFVKTGNPNGEGLPRWEADTNALQSTMRLQNPVYCCHAPNNAGVEYMIKSSTG